MTACRPKSSHHTYTAAGAGPGGRERRDPTPSPTGRARAEAGRSCRWGRTSRRSPTPGRAHRSCRGARAFWACRYCQMTHTIAVGTTAKNTRATPPPTALSASTRSLPLKSVSSTDARLNRATAKITLARAAIGSRTDRATARPLERSRRLVRAGGVAVARRVGAVPGRWRRGAGRRRRRREADRRRRWREPLRRRRRQGRVAHRGEPVPLIRALRSARSCRGDRSRPRFARNENTF